MLEYTLISGLLAFTLFAGARREHIAGNRRDVGLFASIDLCSGLGAFSRCSRLISFFHSVTLHVLYTRDALALKGCVTLRVHS